jgi:hypothetical protein
VILAALISRIRVREIFTAKQGRILSISDIIKAGVDLFYTDTLRLFGVKHIIL